MTKLMHVVSLTLVSALLLTACGKKAEEAEPSVDLSKADDIFEMPAAAPTVDPATVVVTVDETEITQGDVDAEIQQMLARAGRSLPPERLAQMKGQMTQQVLDSLIIRTLLRNAIDTQDVQVEASEVDEGIERLQASLPEGVTMDQQLERLNLTEAELREALELDLRINKLIMSQIEEVEEPTEEEIQAFYEENAERFNVPETVSAKHILVTVKPTDDEETKAAKKAKIEKIRQQLVDGADFEAVAQEESDCPSSARGGDLGTFARGQMVPPFEEAAFSQPIGEVGDVVETQFGYHVILVNEREDAQTLPLEEVSERIAEGLVRQKRQEVLEDYLASLKEEADITFSEQ